MKPSKELKVGDRVAVYLGGHTSTSTERIVGTVLSIDSNAIKTDITGLCDDAPPYVHPKQVRKLVKKPRREFWFRLCIQHGNDIFVQEPGSDLMYCDRCEIVKVREVK